GAHRPGAAGRGRCASLLGAGQAGPGPRHRALRLSDRRRGQPAGRGRAPAPEARRHRAPRPGDPPHAGRGAALSEAVPCSARRACHHRPVRWWQTAVVYQIYPRSFADATGDGVGDLEGIRRRLDHLAWLGVDAVWLSPIFRSPMKDFGYDVSDYCDVDPMFGTLDDFKAMVARAHKLGLKVMIDQVLSHSSDQHPWFIESRSSPDNPKRDWYVWSETDTRYRETRIIFLDTEMSNWAWDPISKSYYWHRFFSHQPDLNYDNPAVREEMWNVMKFWLELGVDGFRLDAVPYLIEREGTSCENLPETHEVIRELRKKVDDQFPGAMLLAEANQ